MSAQHTPKVLKVVRYERACYYEGQERDGWDITGLDKVPDHEYPMFREEDARRLAACWNAFDGLPTDQIESMVNVPKFFFNHMEMMAQRDELLAALDGLLNALPSATTHPAIKAAKAAISNATKEAV